jgi:hypothetical protein
MRQTNKMLIQRKSDKTYLTLSFGWTKNPQNPSLACTTHASLPAVCRKLNIDISKVELIPFETAYKAVIS